MSILHIFLSPALILIFLIFIFSLSYCVINYKRVNQNLLKILEFLKSFNKNDIVYRFKEFDDGLTENSYVSNLWTEFRNTLVFDENIAIRNQQHEEVFETATQVVSGIQTTVDSSFFFNEETLITSHYNNKFVQISPTILTGLGPLFTFMHIAYAFAHVNFLSNENTLNSVHSLMSSMQIAALCSVLAVGTSLIFMFTEKLLYNNKCRIPLLQIQEILDKIFDSVSSEKFLVELLKTTKIQNNRLSNMVSTLPNDFKTAMDKSLSGILIPYLDNILFGINNLNEKQGISSKKNLESIDELF